MHGGFITKLNAFLLNLILNEINLTTSFFTVISVVQSLTTEPMGAGDHLAQQVALRFMTQFHGRGFWRFPVKLLDYQDVVQVIKAKAHYAWRQQRRSSNLDKTWALLRM